MENLRKRDVILQTVSQAFAHRLVLYASSATLSAFPRENIFCDGAEELGSVESEYNGPCLVLLRNCRLAAQALVEHIRSTFLRGYIMRIYWCQYSVSSKTQMISHIRSLVELLRDSGTTSVYSSGFVNDEKIQEKEHGRPQNALGTYDDTQLKFRLQTHPRGLAESLLDELPELECSLHDFTYSIYVVEIDSTFHYGIDIGSNMYLLGPNREALSKGCVSKASTKIEEALHVFNLKLQESMLAPGAWTEYLSRYATSVLAIDPGKLCIGAQKSNVSHICKKVEYAHGELQAWTRTRSFDLLVCDINKHPVEAAEIIAALLPYLRSGGSLILTLKFYGRGKFKDSKINEIFDIFHGRLVEMECIWLMANSIYERTFFGKKS
ncbi:uncharacterized protein LOC131066675 isoform X2 [Cryptomeria japonica]|uniref:uncharacterized protein LOC131066675 isoform X2 n=1 Tax=Cryptomeria japonica TaxID=3369 RepID=UPI0027D9F9C9|nr:uncharacterized protein LOC131066675 isoform X2 [Cryptomeria japonica]